MKKRVLIVVTALLLSAAGITIAQQQIGPPVGHSPGAGPLPPPPSTGTSIFPPPSTTVTTPPVAKEVKPEDLTIEQLIDAMEKTREEIAEREKKNKAMMKVLQDKVNKLKVRMDSFGAKPEQPAVVVPPLGASDTNAIPALIPGPTAGSSPRESGPAPKQP